MLARIIDFVALTQSGFQHTMTRPEFVKRIPVDAFVLEIGPGSAPVVRGPNVRYFDVKDQAALMNRAHVSDEDASGCPFVHYRSETADLGIIPDQFDAVVSSHSIEHQPDLIGHLRSVAALLKSSGAYILAIPDKRYCFDSFASTSTVEDALAAQGRTNHPPATIRDHYRRHTHNSPLRHWLGLHGTPGVMGQPENIEAMCEEAEAGAYIDAHAWALTPQSFTEIVTKTSHLHGLVVELVTDTRFGTLEFYAILRHGEMSERFTH